METETEDEAETLFKVNFPVYKLIYTGFALNRLRFKIPQIEPCMPGGKMLQIAWVDGKILWASQNVTDAVQYILRHYRFE